MERKLQAISSGVKKDGSCVGGDEFGTRVGGAVIGSGVGAIAVGSGVVSAVAIGTVVGGAPGIGEEIGSGVEGAALGSGLVGAAVVATGVGGANEELLAADCGRMTSTTNKAIAPARPNKILPKEIHRYTGRWYHFVLTSGTSNPSGTALWS